MYTLLLVDDEEDVIEVIERKVSWEQIGFHVVGHAGNGFKALEMMEDMQPDVVMTDIRMPYMDGLELCSNIRQRFPATKLLLFTGFDDFEYAKEAVHLEIEEYILKPLNLAEITEVFKKLKTKLDDELNEKKNTDILKQYYAASLPVLQSNFYTTLIEGRIPENELGRYMRDYKIVLEGPYYCCIIIHTSASQMPQGMDIRLLAVSVERQAQADLKERWNGRIFNYLGDTVMIAQLMQQEDISELTDECDRFCKYVNHVMGAKVTVGIGQVCENVQELVSSYQSAREAVSYRVLYGGERAINIREIIPQKAEISVTDSESELAQVLKMIRLGTTEDIGDAIENYLDKVYEHSRSIKEHQVTVMELVSTLYRFTINNDAGMGEEAGEMIAEYSNLITMEKDVLKQWLLEKCIRLHEKIQSARDSSAQSMIRQAKEYVHNNYQKEDLSLDDICEALAISNSYFSSMFKKETGDSFVAYLTQYRMGKAARLLIETTEKSYVIAQSVGYTDPNYFSYVFKRQYGVSPSKYRSEYTKVE